MPPQDSPTQQNIGMEPMKQSPGGFIHHKFRGILQQDRVPGWWQTVHGEERNAVPLGRSIAMNYGEPLMLNH